MLNTIILPSFLLQRSLAKKIAFSGSGVCGLSRVCRSASVVFHQVRNDLTEHFSDRMQLSYCFHHDRGHMMLQLCIYVKHSLRQRLMESQSEHLVEVLEGKPSNLKAHMWTICVQRAFYPGPQFALSFCICSKVRTANEKLSVGSHRVFMQISIFLW